MTTTVLGDNTAPIVNDAPSLFGWGAIIAGALVAAATIFFLVVLGAGVGLMLTSRPGSAVFLTSGAVWVLAAHAFGFAVGGHVTGRMIGPEIVGGQIATRREEEFRAGLHGLVMWAVTVAASLLLMGVVAAAGVSGLGALHDTARGESAVAAYWSDVLLRPAVPHALARGEDLDHDKQEAARVLAVDMHPNAPAHADNRADLERLAMMDAGLPLPDAQTRVNLVEDRMRQEMDSARKAAGYAALWTALALLFGAIVSVAAAISARWEDDKLHFSWARRY